MLIKNLALLVVSIILCQSAGLIGAIFTSESVSTWYTTINKPSFNPPGWVFGPVWTALYLMMGIALYLVIKNGWADKRVKIAVAVFAVQLILNTVWSILFFGMKNPGLAFIEIIFLWIFIALSIYSFWPVSKTASYLLIPYILWVSFASFLNYSIWRLN